MMSTSCMKSLIMADDDDEPNTVGLLSRSKNSPRMFECKTCNRQFPSFQALAGHRASHRKVRHSTAFEETQMQAPPEPTKPRIHECSICGLEFPLGQALGGHMRRHRTNNNNVGKQQVMSVSVPVSGLNLDLNLAPPESEESELADCRDEGGIDLELHLDLAEKVRFVEWLHLG